MINIRTYTVQNVRTDNNNNNGGQRNESQQGQNYYKVFNPGAHPQDKLLVNAFLLLEFTLNYNIYLCFTVGKSWYLYNIHCL